MLSYRSKATTSGTYSAIQPITFSIRPGTSNPITASLDKPSNALGILFIPMGTPRGRTRASGRPTGKAADDRIDDFEQALGIEPVGECGEPGDVREKRRDEPPLLGNLTARRLDQAVGYSLGNEAPQSLRGIGRSLRFDFLRAPTVPAEAHSLGVLAAARRARFTPAMRQV